MFGEYLGTINWILIGIISLFLINSLFKKEIHFFKYSYLLFDFFKVLVIIIFFFFPIQYRIIGSLLSLKIILFDFVLNIKKKKKNFTLYFSLIINLILIYLNWNWIYIFT